MWKSCVKACRSGFTLIELLVVIAIIAILAAILFPVFSQVRERARMAQDTSNLRNIGTATAQYVQDYDERFMFWRTPCAFSGGAPGGFRFTYDAPVPVKIEPYVRNRQVFKCPSTGRNWSWPLACAGDDPQANQQGSCLQWTCGGSYGIGVGRPEWTFFTSHGYNEFVQNNYEGYGSLSRIRTPAEFVLWGDSEAAFFTPWGLQKWGIAAGGYVGYVALLCWPEFWSENSADYNESNAGRHLQGSILSFVDGHVKWYHWRNIRVKRYGGSLSFMRCDEEPCSPNIWDW